MFIVVSLLLAFTVVPPNLPTSTESAQVAATSAWTPHPPIRIVGDSAFTSANGVTGGSGTPSDPYLIENWEIDLAGLPIRYPAIAIEVFGTTASFVIRNIRANGTGYEDGVDFDYLANGRLESSIIDGMANGVNVVSSFNVSVLSSQIASGGPDVSVQSSQALAIRNNSFQGGGVELWGSVLAHFDSHSISGNVLNGRPVIYVQDAQGLDIDSSPIGQLILANCTDVRAHDMNSTSYGFSIEGAFLTSASIDHNRASWIRLVHSQGITVEFNNAQTLSMDADRNVTLGNNLVSGAVLVSGGSNLTLTGNVVRGQGVEISSSRDTQITGNDISAPGWSAIFAYSAEGVSIVGNRLESSQNGIRADASDSIVVVGNTISMNQVGIDVTTSWYWLIHHNNFVSNAIQVVEPYSSWGWNAAYPIGGNFWSDYGGKDVRSGPNQDQPGPDGFGDSPYVIDNVSFDYYPLMKAYVPPLTLPSVGPILTSPRDPIHGQDVEFEASVFDSQDIPVTSAWNFGDGVTEVASTSPGGGVVSSVHAYLDLNTLAFFATLTVDDGVGGVATAYALVLILPSGLLRTRTSLDINTTAGVPGTILVDGVPRNQWGLDWTKAAAEPHTVSFTDVPGLETPSPVTVGMSSGTITTTAGVYRVLGWLRIRSNPPVHTTISVDGLPRDDWGVWFALPPGSHEVSFGPVAGYAPPAPIVVAVDAGGLTDVVGQFSQDPTATGPDPSSYGMLHVTTAQSDGVVGVPSTILVDGIPRDTRSLEFLKLEPGTHTVAFTDVPGLTTPPSEVVEVLAGQTTEIRAVFNVLGFLQVVLNPALPGTVFVDGWPRNDWVVRLYLPAGAHKVSFGPLQGYLTPPSQVVDILAGQTVTVVASYQLAAGA